MSDPKDDDIMIRKVRVSFPHLFKRPKLAYGESKCGACLMLKPLEHAGTLEILNKAIEDLCVARFQGRSIPDDKSCLRKGVDKSRPEYAGYMILSAKCYRRPFVIAKEGGRMITREYENEIYGGCYVNARIRLWAQDNKFGKRINCELLAIQFATDGEPMDPTFLGVEEVLKDFSSKATTDDLSSFLW